jgi:hypothetical protein
MVKMGRNESPGQRSPVKPLDLKGDVMFDNIDDETEYTFDLQLLRNLRSGDVVWVHVAAIPPGEEGDEYIEHLRDTVLDELDDDVAVIITPQDYVEEVRVMDLQSLLEFRDQIDTMISLKMAGMESVES